MELRSRPQIDESFVDEMGNPVNPEGQQKKYRKFTAGPSPDPEDEMLETGIPPKPRPPEGFESFMDPQYRDRDKFSRHAFKVIGGNPFALDVEAEVAKADEELPELFEDIFKGRVIWQDRDKLSKEEATEWNQHVKAFHAHVKDQVISRKKAMTDRYNNMMNMFDNMSEQYKANLERYSKYRIDAQKAGTKQIKGDQSGGASREDLIAAGKYEKEIMSNYDPGQQISEMDLRSINRVRKAVGLPEVKESVTPGTTKENPGLGMFDEVQPDQYSYSEGGGEPADQGKQEKPVKAKPKRESGTALAQDTPKRFAINKNTGASKAAKTKRYFRNKKTGEIQVVEE